MRKKIFYGSRNALLKKREEKIKEEIREKRRKWIENNTKIIYGDELWEDEELIEFTRKTLNTSDFKPLPADFYW